MQTYKHASIFTLRLPPLHGAILEKSTKILFSPSLNAFVFITSLFCLQNLFSQVSEGLDFADRAGRAVVITGIPFPNSKDPKVQPVCVMCGTLWCGMISGGSFASSPATVKE